jgi:hypothetical protein
LSQSGHVVKGFIVTMESSLTRVIKKQSPSARPQTKRVNVSHPTLPGFTEQVDRVVDTLDAMLKAGPRHLELQQWQAAQIFRRAYEILHGAVGGVMDFDRVRAPGFPGATPAPHQLYASERLREARGKLYEQDYLIVELVAGQGRSIAQTATIMLDKAPSKIERTKIGDRLRCALDELACIWMPEARNRPMRTWRPQEAVPTADAAGGEIVRYAAHASHGRITVTR